MPVTLTDEEVLELGSLLIDLHTNPHAGGEIRAMGGLRSVLGRPLLEKLHIEVEENESAEALYSLGP